MKKNNYDVIVIGAGHAGVESALACARMNLSVLIITIDVNKIANTPCNPSVGGPAKGIVTREIDALGGEMAKCTDYCALQVKLLNESKGPGVQALRAQIDKLKYPKYMYEILKNTKNITIQKELVNSLIINDGICQGVNCESKESYFAKAVILTTGTYLASICFNGSFKKESGPENDKTTSELSKQLKTLGFEIIRLKTGTPPRIKSDSINYDLLTKEYGSKNAYKFSYWNTPYLPFEKQVNCWLTYTNEKTHKIIFDNLETNPAYKNFKSIMIGPRYCPSIEEKIIRFKDKHRHQLFLEPESLDSDSIYVQGFSTCMPEEIQLKMLHSIKGLENCKVLKWAYAIEYDAINPIQLYETLETKLIKNLYTAGQINGTSGYEEAAGQGIIAGINAALKIKEEKPLILSRLNSYIGVMIDDLVTKGIDEPYRLLTSKAENRLYLRNDNADMRLSEIGYKINLLPKKNYQVFIDKKTTILNVLEKTKNYNFKNLDNINDYLEKNNLAKISPSISLFDLIKRPEIKIKNILEITNNIFDNISDEIINCLEIEIKYSGYLKKQNDLISEYSKLENIKIPQNFNYKKCINLSNEAIERFSKIIPRTIGQASRIPGITPANIFILINEIKKIKNIKKSYFMN